MRLSELLTTEQVRRVLGYRSHGILYGEYGLTKRYKLTPVLVGTQSLWKSADIFAMIPDVARNLRPQHALYRTEMGERVKIMEQRLAAESSANRAERGDVDSEDVIDIEQVKLIMGLTTREGVYYNADFRGGPIRSVKVGNTYVYYLSDVLDFVAGRLSRERAVSDA